MTEATLLQRQVALDVIVPETITVIGVGGIGFWVAMNAVMLGAKRIIMFDPDTIENHNRNRLPLGEEDVGRHKTAVCRDYLLRLRPECTIIAMPIAINEISISQMEGFVFICTDTLTSQQEIRQYCVANNLPFIRLGYDGRHLTIENLPEVEGLWSSGEEPEGEAERYTVVPSYILTPQMVASLALLMSDMNVWRGFPRRKPNINISGNLFQIGQAIMEGKIFTETLNYPDRTIHDAQMMSQEGRRIRV